MCHGPGGNTSIKIDKSIYVKSSGTWLKDSLKEKSFIKIDLNSIKKNIKNEKKWIFRKSTIHPSIETCMHAVINKKYVVHLHSISVLSYAVLKQGKKILKKKLKGLEWVWIKYKKPGLNLALEIKKKMADNINIYILQNHGIIIASNTLYKINVLLKKIETTLKQKTFFNFKKINVNDFSLKNVLIPNFKEPKNKIIQILAWNDRFYQIIKDNKSLYPDHTVFLSNKIKTYEKESFFSINNEKKIIVIKNSGVFIKNNISSAEYDMLLCLAELLRFIPKNSVLSFLSKKENNKLINWDKEKIRQKFNMV